jgi:hypothetical protein
MLCINAFLVKMCALAEISHCALFYWNITAEKHQKALNIWKGPSCTIILHVLFYLFYEQASADKKEKET